MPSKRRPIEIRFLEKVQKTEKCWFWTGFKNKNGYGYFSIPTGVQGGISAKAHRVSFELFKGPIPKGLYVCHKCDNPSCVNPDHLFVGTNQENIQDSINKNRHKVPSLAGENHGRAILKAADIEKIRALAETGLSQREMGIKFNISRSHIGAIINKKYWKTLA